jgi:hypothetical protein
MPPHCWPKSVSKNRWIQPAEVPMFKKTWIRFAYLAAFLVGAFLASASPALARGGDCFENQKCLADGETCGVRSGRVCQFNLGTDCHTQIECDHN